MLKSSEEGGKRGAAAAVIDEDGIVKASKPLIESSGLVSLSRVESAGQSTATKMKTVRTMRVLCQKAETKDHRFV